jgi:LAGLIDADG endonuclease
MINIPKNTNQTHFVFKITLHIDDINVLYLIQDMLKIGKVTKKGNTANFMVHAFEEICSLKTIFEKYPLLTHKQLNFKDWSKAIELKRLSGKSLDLEVFTKILALKYRMNKSRIDYNGYIVSHTMITSYWLLGFIEGDGTFFSSNNTVVFSIKQKNKAILEEIAIFLQNIPLSPPYDDLVIPDKPNCIIVFNQSQDVYTLSITNIDVLYQYLDPFLKNFTFLTRKGLDFKTWSLILYLIVSGYHVLPEGKTLITKLIQSSNHRRYTTAKNKFSLIDNQEITSLLAIDPPYNIHSGLSHFNLARIYSISKGSRKGFTVYIYKDGVEIPNSPFKSFNQGGKAIGLNSVSSIRNYLDTNKVFKDGYTFYSKKPKARL